MTAVFDESRMIHGGDTDAQLDEIINSTNDADSTANVSSLTRTICKACNVADCDPVTGLCLDINCETNAEFNTQVAASLVLTLSIITQLLTSVVAHNSSDFIAEFNGMSYKYVKAATESVATKLFVCIELVVPMLYWYNPFHGFLTSKKTFICPMGLSNGHVLVAMWRTRCNRPTFHAVLYDPSDDTCYLITTMSEWMKLNFDPSVEYNLDKLKRFYNSVINI